MPKSLKRPAQKGQPVGAYDRSRLPNNTKCDHQTRGPCFLVDIEGHEKKYHWPDEGGAVMFCLVTTRDQTTSGKVFDPDGNLIVQFKPRQYNVKAINRSIRANDALQVSFTSPQASVENDVAVAHRVKLTHQEKPYRKPVKKSLGRKVR